MKTRYFISVFLAGLTLTLFTFSNVQPSVAQTQFLIITTSPPASDRLHVYDTLHDMPLMFVENVGQLDERVRFQIRGGPGMIWLTDEAIWMTVFERPDLEAQQKKSIETLAGPPASLQQGINLKLSFAGANPHPRIEPFNRLNTSASFFIGNDPSKWRASMPVWSGVRYVDLYPGINLELASVKGQWIWQLIVKDNTNLGIGSRSLFQDVRLRVDGAEAMHLDGDYLRLTTSVGELSLPLIQVVGITNTNLTSPTLIGNQVALPFTATVPNPQSEIVNFQSGASDLLYSTFLGGSDDDIGYGIVVDATGAAYVIGTTFSNNFPTTPGTFDQTISGQDIFVTKLNPNGTGLAYSTFLGGSDSDFGYSIAIDLAGAAYITGYTYSTDFPTTPGAFDRTLLGVPDAFVTKINPDGKALAYSTFLGSNGNDEGRGITVDTTGAAYITGSTYSTSFPTTPGAFDTTYNYYYDGGYYWYYDVFVTKLNPAGSGLIYSTYLGGSGNDEGISIVVDATGAVFVTGNTDSTNFPTTPGTFDSTYNSARDVFVSKLNPNGNGLVYSTFLGGSGNDDGIDIAVDTNGAAYVTGDTFSTNFPTTPGAFDQTFNGGQYSVDAFVTKVSAIGGLVYSSFLGGSGDEFAGAIAVDTTGTAYVTGRTDSTNFPTTTNAFDLTNSAGDAFVTKVNSGGSGLVYSTFLGGSDTDDWEYGYGITVNPSGSVYITGRTDSSNFPVTSGVYDALHNGNQDAFVTKLALGGEEPVDRDGDGLPNDWEINGHNGVNLRDMGADPDHKDIFVEIDYMEACIGVGNACIKHSHKPNADAIALVVEAFKNAPVNNPDGIPGINLHVDFGSDTPMKPDDPNARWGSFSRSDRLPHYDYLSWTKFYELKQTKFDSARNGIFHYAIFAHFIEGLPCTSGATPRPIPNVDFIVSLAGFGLGKETACGDLGPLTNVLVGTPFQQAGTFMHELGHNLGFDEGGGDAIIGKPNYLSVMNYAFQMRGLIYDNHNGGTFDYSRSGPPQIPNLVETSLNESVGLNGGNSTAQYGTRWTCPNESIRETLSANSHIDWNCNGNSNETNVSANINNKTGWYTSPSSETLISSFDWENLNYTGGGVIGSTASTAGALEVTSSASPNELTLDQDNLIPDPYKIGLTGPGGLIAPPGYTTVYTFTISNIGDNSDTYTLTGTSSLGWADLTSIPTTASLSPGQTRELAISITIPPTADISDVDVLRIAATSTGNPALWTSHYAQTSVMRFVHLPMILK
ncbi:MAG: SBBP repeat-containing protein [Anaerolineae bacterium]|nr:SBBP repeat-containing protein [Anaerolineae bacterium]